MAAYEALARDAEDDPESFWAKRAEDLHWFKWEAYSTWLSGMGMLAIVYWFGASTYLIDRSVMPLGVPAAIGLSAATIVVGWLVYDRLCRLLRHRDTLLAVFVFVFGKPLTAPPPMRR